MGMPEEYGGLDADRLYSVVLMEEKAHVINGSKIFISNGWHGGIFVVAVQTARAGRARTICR